MCISLGDLIRAFAAFLLMIVLSLIATVFFVLVEDGHPQTWDDEP